MLPHSTSLFRQLLRRASCRHGQLLRPYGGARPPICGIIEVKSSPTLILNVLFAPSYRMLAGLAGMLAFLGNPCLPGE